MRAPNDDDLMQQRDTLQAKKILQVQAVFSVALVLCALLFDGSVALSVLIGAGTCLLANALLVVWVFRDYRAQKPERLVLRFYGAETAKIVLILVLFAVAFATFDHLNVPAVLGAYVVIQVVPTLIAAQFGNRTTK